MRSTVNEAVTDAPPGVEKIRRGAASYDQKLWMKARQ
jgi:hypothetical protein